MTTTYNLALTADKDKIRLLVGDVGASVAGVAVPATEDFYLEDEEINYLLTVQPNIVLCAADAAEAIAAKLVKQIDRNVIDMSASPSRRPQDYYDLADRLRSGHRVHLDVFAGVLSNDGKEDLRQLSDAVQPFFRRKRDDLAGETTGVAEIRQTVSYD